MKKFNSKKKVAMQLWRFPKTTLFIVLLLAGSFSVNAQKITTQLWQDIPENTLQVERSVRQIIPQTYRTVKLNRSELMRILSSAPLETTDKSKLIPTLIEVPMPDGTFQNFSIVNSPVMEAGLAAKFPEIRTFTGKGVEDPSAMVYLDWTYKGFHLMILSNKGSVFIDPFSSHDQEHYIAYYKRDFLPSAEKLLYGICQVGSEFERRQLQDQFRLAPELLASSGTQLRTYRAAVAATGQYTVYHGGTISGALSAIVTSMNRVNGIYMAEVAVRMILVANNDLIIYTDSLTDPYTNGNAGAMINENQANVTLVIGSANFDIGHVFGTNSGGLAGPGPCQNASKARGVTGSANPVGDPFDVDYVAHEMGHQFSAAHTFNGNISNCLNNRSASSAYEPGSGTTIMAYAGICGSNNLQPNSDPYFHTRSFDQIVVYTTVGSGNSCAVVTPTGNNPPTADAGTGGFTIPKGTPFILTGSGSDPDGHALTYCWEEFDLGPQGAPNSPVDDAPIFRSFNPTTSTSRIFPKLSDILNNTQTLGELLPSYGRNLTFRLTTRDNQVNGGGVNYDDMAFVVSGTAGPFLVTSPNTAVSWCAGNTETVTWNVAGTDAAPVSTANVNILLSTDGGNTWPVTLIANTPNDGSQNITVPNNAVFNNARVKVEAVGNIYFDISNVNFTIYEPPVVTLHPQSQAKEWGDNVTFTATATGTPTPTRQWQISTNGGATFTDIPGETGTSLTLTCLTLAENNNQYRIEYTNICDVIYSNAATLTVTPRTTTATLTVTPNPQQYSDLVTFYVLLENAAKCGAQAATDVSFYIGTQFFGTVTLTANGDDLEATLANQALLEPSPMGTAPTGQMAPGIHDAIAVFSGSNSNFTVENDTIDMTIEQEDARAYYTGACFASTLGVSNCNAVVTLSATIKDITAVVGDPDYDPNAGDIRYATLSFINRATNTVIASNVPIGLVSLLDKTIAVGTYNWNVCIAGNSQTFEIGIIVDGYYTRNSSADNVLVTVSKPVGNFVTGGGYIILANSAGIVAGDAGTKSNFGFNTKFNQQGTNLQGNVNILVRRTEVDGLHTYKIKSNIITSLGIQKESWGGKSIINSKAIVQDITDPNNVISIFGNGSMQIKFTDRGEPGSSDSIAITIWNKQGGLWYSSNWNSTNTVEQILNGGNLKISSNNSYVIREAGPVTENIKSITVYPNPASGMFHLDVNPESGTQHQLAIFDIYGKQVFAADLNDENGTGSFDIDLTGHAAGIYLIRLSAGSEVQFVKMLIE